jgi:hypothetical protein
MLVPREQIVPLASVKELIQSGQRMRLPPITVAFKGKGIVRSLGYEGHADVIVFNHSEGYAWVVELKEGDNFDTKKSAGERQGLEMFAGWLATVTEYRVFFALCSFHQEDHTAIVRGLKGKFARDEVMTGQELCRSLGIEHADVLRLRSSEQQRNLGRLANRLVEIPELRELLIDRIERRTWLRGKQQEMFGEPEDE